MESDRDEMVSVRRGDILAERLLVAEAIGLLNVIVNDLSGLMSLSALLKVAVRKAAEIFPVRGAAIYRLDVINGTSFAEAESIGVVDPDYDHCALQCLKSGLVVNRNCLVVPIAAGEDLLGVFRLDFVGDSDYRMDLVMAYARYLATRILEIHGRRTIALQMPGSILKTLPLDPEKLVATGQRVKATVIFADVRGFTPLAERIPPETLQMFLNRYFALMEPLIRARNGTVIKFLADGILAVWGAPQKDPAQTFRAVGCALEMVKIFKSELTNLIPGETLCLGIGIDLGEIVAGYFGSPERLGFDIIGDTVNTASRIQAEATDAVFISERVYKKVRKSIRCQPCISLTLKGKKGAQRVYQVLGVSD